ncbi:Uncharacterised protein [Vibrio cholerae]|nr:Uncharacterised protein [Vibrio cholerae]
MSTSERPNTPIKATSSRLNSKPHTFSTIPSANICSAELAAILVETNCGKNSTKNTKALGFSKLLTKARW